MLNPICKIVINGITFDFVATVKIHSTWQKHTDTATITIPKRIGFKDKDGNSINTQIVAGNHPTFKRGNAVEIWLGYGNSTDNLVKEFEGVISNVIPKYPITIECEDIMWNLKQIMITKSYTNVTLKQMYKDIVPPQYYNADNIIDVNIGSFNIDYKSVVEIFDYLATGQWGIQTFAKGGKIVACLGGYVLPVPLDKFHNFTFQKNIISDDLTFNRKDDAKFKVRAVNFHTTAGSKGKKDVLEFGDKDGESVSFNFLNVPKQDLEKIARAKLETLKYDGYKGKFRAFGQPSVQHGEAVVLTNEIISDQNGSYLIKSVEKEFGFGIGFKQHIELDRIIS